jgi:Leucine-rich repeat (LRR) protein
MEIHHRGTKAQRRKGATMKDFEKLIAGCGPETTTLDLSATQVVDVSPLAALTNLTELYLSDTQVVDVSPLAALTKCKILR